MDLDSQKTPYVEKKEMTRKIAIPVRPPLPLGEMMGIRNTSVLFNQGFPYHLVAARVGECESYVIDFIWQK